MPTMHEPAARAGLVERARTLSPSSIRRWGRMNVDQMVWHVNAQLEAAMGHRSCVRIDNAMKRTVIKAIALYGPWPKEKAPTAREMRASGTYDLPLEVARFEQLSAEFAARPLDSEWPPHPAFGRLTGPQWSRLAWRHASYHLRQFSA